MTNPCVRSADLTPHRTRIYEKKQTPPGTLTHCNHRGTVYLHMLGLRAGLNILVGGEFSYIYHVTGAKKVM